MDVAEVYLWGTRIGVVAQRSLTDIASFNYDENFLNSGIEVAPLVMPLNKRVYSFPNLSVKTFHALPGLLADSLPDKFGTKVIEKYLADQGRDIRSLSAVERLLYTGKRGMGALEYVPQKDYAKSQNTSIDITALVDLATKILSDRENIHITEDEHAMEQIINVGTSAGGARAKAIVAWNKEKRKFRSGQINAGEGYEYWLIKFDGVKNNKDKGEKADGPAYTRIEYAYSLMAKQAGIIMSDCQLYQQNGAFHFMTKRFDRNTQGNKLHMQTLGALAHFDYNEPGLYSYEQAANVLTQLKLGGAATEQLFRRMTFNILSRNQDDHVKNISFLMDRNGKWTLSPAYDITFAYDVTNHWLARHQMSMNGKLDGFLLKDFYSCGKSMNLSKAKVTKILDETRDAITAWDSCAEQAFLTEETMLTVKNQFENI